MTASDLRKVVKAKLKAAKILYKAKDYDTAGYLLGYVVECSLKALICKKLNLDEYPDTGKHYDVFASHDLDRLMMLSGYSSDFRLEPTSGLVNNWGILTKDWKPEIRYNIGAYNSDLIQTKLNALEDKDEGFFTWIKKRW